MAEKGSGLPALLDRVRQRDQAAARALVEQLGPLVLRIVRAHRPRRMAEEDLCQEVFMSVFASIGQYQGTVPFEHWVSRVAVNTCIDQLRRHKSRPELRWADLPKEEAEALQAMLGDEDQPDPQRALAVRETVGRLLDCLAPEDRLLIQWLEIEDRTVNEVSARTGWNVPKVKVRAFRARRRMRKALEQILESEQL
jgi:RNA polymerase sigma-70 factor (ECF subfamily)